ncbi:MAG: chemotaxis protein CheW [Lachnospiraceae bacterium]|nr:chemotaxis protein CheW [Lachnospiraceae bacterium]
MEEISDVQNLEIAGEGKQYIVVRLGTEQYGIDIKYVDNIVRNQRITRVPKAQHYFKGVINLRGEIIPVMSLRLKFGLKPDEYTNATRIIIIKLEQQSAIGIIVDEVKEVVTLTGNSIDKANTSDPSDPLIQYLSGVGKHGNGLISLLNISAVIVGRESKDVV